MRSPDVHGLAGLVLIIALKHLLCVMHLGHFGFFNLDGNLGISVFQ